MIRTKSIRDPEKPSDGNRILVMRYWPRTHSKKQLCLSEWYPDLGPSKQLLKDWHTRRISWDQYTEQYLAEMQDQQGTILDLAQAAKTGTITLLCIEPETNPHCHRHLLKSLIEKALHLDSTGICPFCNPYFTRETK